MKYAPLALLLFCGCTHVRTYRVEPIQTHPCVRYVTIDFAKCKANVCDGVKLIQDCVSAKK